MTAIVWWADQIPAVRAVLDLANLADADDMVATFAPGMADTIDVLGSQLVEIDALGSGDTDLLATYFDEARIRVLDADQLADELIAQIKADALASAQLCASVLTARARRLRSAA